MDTPTTGPNTAQPPFPEMPRRWLDPSGEARDCANQWDVSGIWQTVQHERPYECTAVTAPEGPEH